jgi:hypothetical protein
VEQKFFKDETSANNYCPLSKAQTVRVRENPISFLNSTLKNTFRKVISIISIRAVSFNYSFESFRITRLSLKLVMNSIEVYNILFVC